MKAVRTSTSVAERQQACNNDLNDSESKTQSHPVRSQNPDSDGYPLRAFDDPHRLAEDFIEQHCRFEKLLTLRHYHNEFYHWKGDRWQAYAPYEIDAN